MATDAGFVYAWNSFQTDGATDARAVSAVSATAASVASAKARYLAATTAQEAFDALKDQRAQERALAERQRERAATARALEISRNRYIAASAAVK